MDKDRFKGVAQKIKGHIEVAVGKVTGNKPLETDGKIDNAIGTARKAVGEAKDTIRDAVKERSK